MIKCLRYLLKFFWRFRAYNEAVLRTPGPVLLIPNHVSWIDWLFVGVCLEPIRRLLGCRRGRCEAYSMGTEFCDDAEGDIWRGRRDHVCVQPGFDRPGSLRN